MYRYCVDIVQILCRYVDVEAAAPVVQLGRRSSKQAPAHPPTSAAGPATTGHTSHNYYDLFVE